MHAACKTGHSDVIELLLKADADVSCRTNDDITPLYISAYNGHSKVSSYRTHQHTQCQKRYECLIGSSLQVVGQLLKAGAKMEEYNASGWTALHAASERGHTDVIDVLIQNQCDVNTASKSGDLALHVAAR